MCVTVASNLGYVLELLLGCLLRRLGLLLVLVLLSRLVQIFRLGLVVGETFGAAKQQVNGSLAVAHVIAQRVRQLEVRVARYATLGLASRLEIVGYLGEKSFPSII